MATKKSFPTLSSTASKAEEIEHLETFAASLERGTYLADAFNPNLIGWIAQNIKSDIIPNMHEWIVFGDTELRKELEAERKAAKEAKAELSWIERQMEEKDAWIAELEERVNQRNGMVEAQAEAIDKLQGTVEGLERKNAELEAEITRLKAMLFDALYKNGAAS
jgi:hypothetical protein